MSGSIGLFFLAGLISFLSPCVLSLVPAYLGALGYESANSTAHRNALATGAFFFLGFTCVFLTLGFTATLIGNLIAVIKPWIGRIGGLVLIIMGLQLTGWVNLSFLNYELHPTIKTAGKNRYFAAFLMGIVFSAGWSPCIGPILGSVLTALAIKNTTIPQGLVSLLFYSLGLGIPFLIIASGFQPVLKWLIENKQTLHFVQVVCGVLLCVSGLLLLLGVYTRLAQFSTFFII